MTVCETTITYNNITLKNVLTEGVEFEPVFDKTNVNFIGMRTVVTCTAMAHTHDGGVYEHGVSVTWQTGESGLGPGLTALMRKLLQPRKRFVMKVGGMTMFNILPTMTESCNSTPIASYGTMNVDIEHGPKCSVRVLSIIGDNAARCRFTFTFVTPICDDPTKILDFLSLRYWIADEIDCKNWTTVRTYSGTLRVRGLGVDPHVLARSITIPPLQYGFRRDHITWNQSPDGLTLDFTIVDVEQWAVAPKPATFFTGTYSLFIPQADITHHSTLQFTLRGAKEPRMWSSEKLALMKLAQNIIDSKLHFGEMMKDTAIIVTDQRWDESLEDCEISVNISLQHTGKTSLVGNLMQTGKWFEFGKPLGASVSVFNNDAVIGSRDYDKDTAYIPEAGPSAGLKGIFLCALQNPCCPQAMPTNAPPPNDYEENTNQDVGTNLPREITVTEDPNTHRFDGSHRKSPYTYYRISSDYRRDTGWRGFPKGSQCQAGTADTMAFAQVHCDVCIREIRIEASRVNEWPVIPDMRHSWEDTETGIKYVLRDSILSPSPPMLAADGKHDLREVYASYYYYMSRPLTNTEYHLAGNLPYVDLTKALEWESDSTAKRAFPPKSLLNPDRIFGNDITSDLQSE